MIKHHKHNQIDSEKWDQCINESAFGNIFCTYWYLSIIHPDWEALIFEQDKKYKLAIPLLHTRRGAFNLHRTPILAQRLGIFAYNLEIADYIYAFLVYVKKKYSVFHYPLDLKMVLKDKQMHLEKLPNYFLDLNSSYSDLFAAYRRDRKARLKKAKSFELHVEFTGRPDILLKLLKENVAANISGGIGSRTLSQINQLISESVQQKTGFVAMVTNEKNNPLSAAFFIKYKNRLTYLFAANNKEGKHKNANTLLLDSVINNYSSSPIILDFEGSSVKGIADFYVGFGAKREYYYKLIYESALASTFLKFRRMQLSLGR
ncbi:hypothetical protein FNH22_15375 [Fulvivirga sp. M361]|uniref:hypothetical protein n=1 Tax=Fulvivirga sp. M361 TaxID=2594266 RepID=UPI001179FD79|nr:hypothetical protein [Fulvivirga sp. M361]TRX57787.1 hypothetical protein FNH22_15375 [Fulvivirga sp. M361]